MVDSVVVPERVKRAFLVAPRGEFKAWQFMGAGAPELAKWQV